ncbi:MAG: KPN_02809 family neutral zinc metallopeptidase [Jatrophihabitans sp.]
MQYNDDAKLDTSEVQDTRRSALSGGKGAAALGGGGLGVIGLVIVAVLTLTGHDNQAQQVQSVLGQLGQGGSAATADNSEIEQSCKTGKDANDKLECAIIADIDSIQNYWTAELPKLGTKYTSSPTIWFSGQVQTACGGATSGSGPFYCPGDRKVYIDLTFYDDLKKQFGATGGPFVNAYVLAHEYGHHVQDLLGTESKVKPGQSGPTSGSVRLELQADCYAGVWANHASTVPDDSGKPLITAITQDDINNALDAASRIGDDFIQKNLGNSRVDTSQFTHGSSAQRQKWFTTGYQSGDPRKCDTFTSSNLG